MAKMSKRGKEAKDLITKWMHDRFDGKRSNRQDRLAFGRMVLAKCPHLTSADVTALDAHVVTIAR